VHFLNGQKMKNLGIALSNHGNPDDLIDGACEPLAYHLSSKMSQKVWAICDLGRQYEVTKDQLEKLVLIRGSNMEFLAMPLKKLNHRSTTKVSAYDRSEMKRLNTTLERFLLRDLLKNERVVTRTKYPVNDVK
jgi:hypothetical protein